MGSEETDLEGPPCSQRLVLAAKRHFLNRLEVGDVEVRASGESLQGRSSQIRFIVGSEEIHLDLLDQLDCIGAVGGNVLNTRSFHVCI